MSDFLSFSLSNDFIEPYKTKDVPWGFNIGGGNSLSELTFVLKYSRKKEDGTKEQWWEVCRRCVEGYYSILKDHAKARKTHWNDQKAQRSAEDAFDRMFNFKWTPPGRGMQHMGTEYIAKSGNGARLINCSFLGTEKINTGSKYEATMPFVRLMEMSMNGIGVGIDTRGAGNITLHQPDTENSVTHVIEDTREAWAESLGVLLESFFFKNRKSIKFDYSKIRPEGTPLKSFGGVASGEGPLRRMHEKVTELLSNREGEKLSSRDIVDISNLTGKAAQAGGSRRSALISFGYQDDTDYINIKNWELEENFERMGNDGWGNYSNNSVLTNAGEDLSALVDQIAINGEPGFLWVDLMQQYGRLADPRNDKDYRATGTNPCFAGDTLIAVADGRGYVPIAELAASGDDIPVYSVDPKNGAVSIQWARRPRLTRQDSDLIKVTFNDRSSVKVTPDHEFILLDGTVKAAKDLSKNDRLPAFTKRKEPIKRGGKNYWRVNCNVVDSRVDRIFEHRLISEFFEPDKWTEMYAKNESNGWINGGVVVHHKDYDSLNNSPDNLQLLTFAEHAKIHAIDNTGEKNGMFGKTHSQETKNIIGAKARERFNDPEYKAYIHRRSSEAMKAPEVREKLSNSRRSYLKRYYLEQESNTDLATVWYGDSMFVVKSCEECGSTFEVAWGKREQAFCGRSCAILYTNNKYDSAGNLNPATANRIKGIRDASRARSVNTRNAQINTYLDLQVRLGRDPLKVEWEAECKASGVPVRFQAKGKTENPHIFYGYNHLKRCASAVNHRVVSVEVVDKEDVYNLTVDNNHTVGIVTRVEDKSLHGIYAFQCGEIALESSEQCNLGEIYPTNHDDVEDLKHTIKHAYMYTKAVSMLQTPWPETNEVIMRNHRVGISMTGLAQFVETRGWQTMANWFNEGYRYLSAVDKKYSEWLGVRESIKMSTVKPSGSTALISGVTPGVHWPTTSGYHIRRIRFNHLDPLLDILREAGYHTEPDVMDPNSTVVVSFPTEGIPIRSEREVSIWEKASLAALAQRYWSDNLVSCTLSFRPDEKDQLKPLLSSFQGQLKSASFLPIDDSGTTYAQAPYEPISEDDAKTWMDKIVPIDASRLYGTGAAEFVEDKFCTTDSCEISF